MYIVLYFAFNSARSSCSVSRILHFSIDSRFGADTSGVGLRAMAACRLEGCCISRMHTRICGPATKGTGQRSICRPGEHFHPFMSDALFLMQWNLRTRDTWGTT